MRLEGMLRSCLNAAVREMAQANRLPNGVEPRTILFEVLDGTKPWNLEYFGVSKEIVAGISYSSRNTHLVPDERPFIRYRGNDFYLS